MKVRIVAAVGAVSSQVQSAPAKSSAAAADAAPAAGMAALSTAVRASPKAAVAAGTYSFGAMSFGAGGFGAPAAAAAVAAPKLKRSDSAIAHTDDKESVEDMYDVLLTEITALVHSVSATALCQSALSTSSWLSLLLALGVYGPVSAQRRAMRLLRRLVPATRPGSLVLDLPAAKFTSERGGALTLVNFLMRLIAVSFSPPRSEEVENWPGLFGAPYIMSSRASECIALLRCLLAAPEHHAMVEGVLEERIRGGLAVREALDGDAGRVPDQDQLFALALCATALCVTGGYVELVRAGGSVRVVKSPGMVAPGW
jgi:hypothetical protein